MYSEMATTTRSSHNIERSVRMLIVSDRLPLEADQRTDQAWSFEKDKDSFLFKLEAGLRNEMLVFHVGSLKVNIHEDKQQEVSKTLLDKLCIPTFLPRDISKNSYCFCKGYLWPLFHSVKHFRIGQPVRPLWDAYVSANRLFSEKVMEVYNPERDYIWIHDYHLMLLPSFLRQRHVRMKIGFFLHIPFPSFEDYKTLFVKEEIIKCLLNCDVIGFHNYEDARNFCSCCSRIIGLQHDPDDGFLEYYGRNIRIKVMPVPIDTAQIVSKMEKVKWTECQAKTQHLVGKTVLLSIDDINIFKGTEQRLLAMEHMLKQYPETQGRAVLVQILNPARDQGIHYDSMLHNIRQTCERINKTYSKPDYKPIYLLEHRVCTIEKFAYYRIAECLVVTHLEDGLKLYPYEYIACREQITGSGSAVRGKSMLVISEFLGCFLPLRGALLVNPWNVEEVATRMYDAISMKESHKFILHRMNYENNRMHGLISWSKRFYKNMVEAWESQSWRAIKGVDSCLHFRVVSIDPSLKRLWVNTMASDYMKAKTRVILLGYDGTLIPRDSGEKSPHEDVITTLNDLCQDNRNVVFVVSGRGKDSLGERFKSCKNLGIVAEHGLFLRWPGNEKWETFSLNCNMHWKMIANHTMGIYTSVIAGSYIERKVHALVWNYENAHSELASSMAKKLLNDLEDGLVNHPVTVKSGKFTVEVETQVVNKGKTAKKIFESMAKNKEKGGTFILSIGDDEADEKMFKIVNATAETNLSSPNSVFTCTVGEKPTRANYYLNDTVEVFHILARLSTLYFLKEKEDS